MLLDRRKVKLWQKWVFGFMAVIMAGFLIMIPVSSSRGCGGASSAVEQLNDDIAAGEAAVKAAPQDAAAWRALGDNYVLRANQQPQDSAEQRADWSKGAAAYQRAVSLEAKQGAAKSARLTTLERLAGVYAFLEEHAQATRVYARITELSPKDAQAFFSMAYSAINAGDTHTAVLAFSRFLELEPNSPDAPAVKEWIEQNTQSAAPTPASTSTKGSGS